MLNLIRAYTPFSVLIFLIAGFVIHAGALVSPVAPAVQDAGPVFELLLRGLDAFFRGSAFGYTLLALLIVLGQLLYLNLRLLQHRVFLKAGYVPAFTGLLLSALLPALGSLLPWLFSSGCWLLGFGALLQSNSTQGGRRVLFNAGFWFGAAALLYFPATIFVLVLALGLGILRPFKGGEWMVTLLGFFTPFYFAAAIFFLVDVFPVLAGWPRARFAFPKFSTPEPAPWIAFAGSALLLLTGAVVAARQASRSAISVRRIWLIIAIGVVVALGIAFPLIQESRGGVLMWAILWATPVVAAPIAAEKKSRFGTFIFYFLIALVAASKLL